MEKHLFTKLMSTTHGWKNAFPSLLCVVAAGIAPDELFGELIGKQYIRSITVTN